MNATELFIGLVLLLTGLFVVALIKPYLSKKQAVSIEVFKDELARLLPAHDFIVKQGVQSRIIISLNGIQKAIVVMDKPKPEYVMGNLPIFTIDKLSELKTIANKIKASHMVMN